MVAKMTAQQKIPVDDDSDGASSQLSALVDEELEDREIDLVLRRLLRDSQPRGQWERYHLIHEAIQGHLPDAFDTGFSARIRQAIDVEPALKPAATPGPIWYKPIAGFGLAASVVLLALFGLKPTQEPTPASQAIASVSPGTGSWLKRPSTWTSASRSTSVKMRNGILSSTVTAMVIRQVSGLSGIAVARKMRPAL